MQAEITRQQQYIDAVHGRLKAQGLLLESDNVLGSPLSQQAQEATQGTLAAPSGTGKGSASLRPDAQSDTATHIEQEPRVLQPLPGLDLGKGIRQSSTEESDAVAGPSTPKQVASSASPAKPGGFLACSSASLHVSTQTALKLCDCHYGCCKGLFKP